MIDQPLVERPLCGSSTWSRSRGGGEAACPEGPCTPHPSLLPPACGVWHLSPFLEKAIRVVSERPVEYNTVSRQLYNGAHNVNVYS